MRRDPRIDAYIERAAPFARPILEHIRDRVHAAVPEADEAIKWNMPTYLKDGSILLITAAFKSHAALNFWRGKEVASAHDSVGAMGQFGRLTSLADLPPDDELDRLIREAAERAEGPSRPRIPKHAPKAPSSLHPDFAAALATHGQAKTGFDALAPSHQRDYVDWIADAKQDATRARRIANAVEWLAEGKRRNWKYEQR